MKKLLRSTFVMFIGIVKYPFRSMDVRSFSVGCFLSSDFLPPSLMLTVHEKHLDILRSCLQEILFNISVKSEVFNLGHVWCSYTNGETMRSFYTVPHHYRRTTAEVRNCKTVLVWDWLQKVEVNLLLSKTILSNGWPVTARMI